MSQLNANNPAMHSLYLLATCRIIWLSRLH